jgi:hypothetical protein
VGIRINLSEKTPPKTGGKTGTDLVAGKRVDTFGHVIQVEIDLVYLPSKQNQPCKLYWGEKVTGDNVTEFDWTNQWKTYKRPAKPGPFGLHPWYDQAKLHREGKQKCDAKGTFVPVTILDAPGLNSKYKSVTGALRRSTARRVLAFWLSVFSGSKRCPKQQVTEAALQVLNMKAGQLVDPDTNFVIGINAVKKDSSWPGDPGDVVDEVEMPDEMPMPE